MLSTITAKRTGITSFSDYAIAVTGGSPLPVELKSFTGKQEDGSVLLKWTTSSETNNEYFGVQKSQNGKDFKLIGKVKGSGNSSVNKNYEFSDPSFVEKIAYYRLKQVDYNGEFEYSNIISISNTIVPSLFTANVYPNPTHQDNINIHIETDDKEQPVLVTLLNGEGREVFKDTYKGDLVADEIRLDIPSRLLPGIYYAIISQSGKVERKKLIIK